MLIVTRVISSVCRDILYSLTYLQFCNTGLPSLNNAGHVSKFSIATRQQFSLMLLDHVCEKCAMRSMRRYLLRWKQHSDRVRRDAERISISKRRDELEAEYAASKKLLLQQHRESEQVLLREQSRAMRDEHASVMHESAAQQAQEIEQYKKALLRQRQRLLQMASAWSKQQAEHSTLSAETDEMLRAEQQRFADTVLEHSRTVENLESAVASRQVDVETAESKLRDMEGIYQPLVCALLSRL